MNTRMTKIVSWGLTLAAIALLAITGKLDLLLVALPASALVALGVRRVASRTSLE